LWIAAGLAAIALGGVKSLTSMLPTSMATPMAMAWLPQMPRMAAGIAPRAPLTLAAPPALRLLPPAAAPILVVLIPTGLLSWGGHFGSLECCCDRMVERDHPGAVKQRQPK